MTNSIKIHGTSGLTYTGYLVLSNFDPSKVSKEAMEMARGKINFGSYIPYPKEEGICWHHAFGVELGEKVKQLYDKYFEKHTQKYVFNCQLIRDLCQNTGWLGRDLSEVSELFRNKYVKYSYATDLEEEERASLEAFLIECRNLVPPIERNEHRIGILTSRIRGGHETAARALEKDWAAKGYEVEVFYTDEPERDHLEEHGITYEGEPMSFRRVRDELYIGMRDRPAGEILLNIDSDIKKYHPGECFEKTMKKIQTFAPKIVISTCHHLIEDHFRYAIYAEEFKLVLTDYREPSFLSNIFRTHISFLAPTKWPCCIKTTLPLECISPAVDPCFLRPRTKEDITCLREEYKIPKDHPIILVSFGGAPVTGVVHHACLELRKVEGSFTVIVVCGGNVGLVDEIRTAHPDYIVLPQISPEQMSDLFYLADCIIGKPGGGMCMQIEAVAIPHFLMYAAYEQEDANVDAIEEMGLGSVVRMNLRKGTSDLREKMIEGTMRAEERRLHPKNFKNWFWT